MKSRQLLLHCRIFCTNASISLCDFTFFLLLHQLITNTPTAQAHHHHHHHHHHYQQTSRLQLVEKFRAPPAILHPAAMNSLARPLLPTLMVIKPENEMSGACGTNGTDDTFCRVLVRIPEAKEWLGRLRLRWENTFKMDLKPIGWKNLA